MSDSNSNETSNVTSQVEGKKFKFNFKTTELVVRDSEGAEISRTKVEPHPAFEAVLPVPSVAEVIGFLSKSGETEQVGDKQVLTTDAKVAAMIMEGVADYIYQAARAQIAEYLEKAGEGARFNPTNFDLSQLTLPVLATTEGGRRGAYAPSEAELAAFCAEYTNVFTQVVRYEPKRIKVHCEQFQKGFAKVRTDKIALGKLRDFLVTFAANCGEQAMSEHEQVYSWLMNRSKKYIEASEKNFAEAL